MVYVGDHNADTARVAQDMKAVVEHHVALFGESPVTNYLFMTMLTADGFGGLEHRSSTALMYPRGDLPRFSDKGNVSEGYRTFLSLCSHELFHTWHVKRIRPEALKQSRLSEETYTPQLWIYEGFTSYYDDFSLLRAGLISRDDYLEVMGQNLTRLLRNTGRHKQTVTESSFDAWTRFYKQDANSINHIVSYYNKGAIVALCLDLLLKQQSEGKYSLDDVMRTLWQKHGAPDIGTDNDVIEKIINSVPDIDATEVKQYLESALYSVNELPVEGLLSSVGVTLHTRPRSSFQDKGGKPSEQTVRVAIGANCKARETGLTINQVLEGSPAAEAHLQVGDVVIAADEWQVSASNWIKTLEDLLDSGLSHTTLSVLRDQRLLHLTFPLRESDADTVYLTVEDEDALKGWFG